MGILGWGFRANVKVHQGESVELELKDKSGKKSLGEYVQSLGLPSKLWLNPWLFNGVLQTLYYASSKSKVNVFYGRELFTYSDDGTCSLDWVIPHEPQDVFQELHDLHIPKDAPRLHPRTRYFSTEELEKRHTQLSESDKPIVVILHGLAGGSHEPLIRQLAHSINDEWDTVVLNNRGCCRTKITTSKLYTAASTGDIHEVLVDLKKRYPHRPLYAVGFSFGAIMLGNYLGQNEGLLKAACLVACGWDLVDSAYHLESSWSGSYLFNPSLTTFLNKLVKSNYATLREGHSEVFNDETIKEGALKKRTWEFDQLYTCKLAGYGSAFEYYRENSPARNLPKYQTPTLCLNSTDDPCVGVRLPIHEAKANPYVSFVETDLGGHLAWVQNGGKYWGAQVVEDFFEGFEKTFA